MSLRNIHRAEYLVLHDIDELLIPYKHETWYDLLDYLNKSVTLSHYASIRFDSLPWRGRDGATNIPTEIKCNISLPYYFDMNYKAEKIDDTRPKVMVSLDKSLSVNTHFVSSANEGVEREYRVKPSVGCYHHYRIPPLNGKYKYDPVMQKFVKKVMPSITKMLC